MHVQSSLSLWLILIRQTLNWLTTVSFFCLSTSKTVNLGEFDNCYSRVLNALKMIFFLPELIPLAKNESFSMSEFCPTLLTPLVPLWNMHCDHSDVWLHQSSGSLLSDSKISSYRRLIGRLIYLTNTRPDITFVVQHLSQFIASPTTAYYTTLYRILCYIKVAPGLGIFFPYFVNLHMCEYIYQFYVYLMSDVYLLHFTFIKKIIFYFYPFYLYPLN